MSETFKKNIQSRKLIFAGTLFVTSVVFVCVSKANFSEWASFMQWVAGVYMAGNVGEHIANQLKK